jgi:hypothetical protein
LRKLASVFNPQSREVKKKMKGESDRELEQKQDEVGLQEETDDLPERIRGVHVESRTQGGRWGT